MINNSLILPTIYSLNVLF